jgi:hypothetical protein
MIVRLIWFGAQLQPFCSLWETLQDAVLPLKIGNMVGNTSYVYKTGCSICLMNKHGVQALKV